MIETRYLKHFIAVVEAGGIRQASKNIYISASSILRSIRQIEEFYDVTLFNKKGKKLYLTSSGEYLLREVRPLIAQLDHLAPKLKKVEGIGTGCLRIGLAPLVADLLMPTVTARLMNEHPLVQFKTTIGAADILLHKLGKQELDLAIGYENVFLGSDKFKCTRIYEEKGVWLVRKNHPLLQKKELEAINISDYPILTQRMDPVYGQRLKELCHLAGAGESQRAIISECDNYRLLAETTERTDGIMLAGKTNFESKNFTQNLRRLRLPVDAPPVWFCASYPLTPIPSPLIHQYIEVFQEEAEKRIVALK